MTYTWKKIEMIDDWKICFMNNSRPSFSKSHRNVWAINRDLSVKPTGSPPNLCRPYTRDSCFMTWNELLEKVTCIIRFSYFPTTDDVCSSATCQGLTGMFRNSYNHFLNLNHRHDECAQTDRRLYHLLKHSVSYSFPSIAILKRVRLIKFSSRTLPCLGEFRIWFAISCTMPGNFVVPWLMLYTSLVTAVYIL